MRLRINVLSIIIIVFLISSCGKKESANIEVNNKKLRNETHKIIRKNGIAKQMQPINNPTSQVTKKTAAKIDQVKKRTDKLLNAMKEGKKSNIDKNQEKADLLNIDWRDIKDEKERYDWASQVIYIPMGRQKALEAYRSLTNSDVANISAFSYMILARAAGKDSNILKVKTLLEDCERKLGLNPNERDYIKQLSYENGIYLSRVWKIRAALSRELAKQKFNGQYDSNIDIKLESYWHRIRLEWENQRDYHKTNNRKAEIYADIAYALMNEKKQKEAIKQLDNAINHLSECEKSKYNKRKMEEYKKIRKEFICGNNYAPATYYW